MIEEPKKVKPIRMKLIDGAEVPAEVLTKRGLTKKQLQQLEKVKQSSCIVVLIQNGMVSKNTYMYLCPCIYFFIHRKKKKVAELNIFRHTDLRMKQEKKGKQERI